MAKKRNTTYKTSQVRKLMKAAGATIVSKQALQMTIQHLEADTATQGACALKLAQHAHRKKVNKADIILARDTHCH